MSPQFDTLFEFGIDPPVGQAATDQPSDWPGIDEIQAYNRRVRARIDELLDRAPEQIVQVALEHRLMHAETLAYLLHNLPYDQKASSAAPNSPLYATRSSNPDDRNRAGLRHFGTETAATFGWDNEFDRAPGKCSRLPHQQVQDYERPVSRFRARRRRRAAFLDPTRRSSSSIAVCFPKFPLPLNAPVYVTHAEASAYARWAGKRLPTEPEFHRAAYETPPGGERPYPWGNAEPDASRGNFDFHHWDPVDVNANPAGDSACGVSQLVGNGWEWTATQFGPFPGFQPMPFYPGYSQNFFDEEHYVMKGGSPVTAACMLRRSFRNWFRPNYPYVYASFRLVED